MTRLRRCVAAFVLVAIGSVALLVAAASVYLLIGLYVLSWRWMLSVL